MKLFGLAVKSCEFHALVEQSPCSINVFLMHRRQNVACVQAVAQI